MSELESFDTFMDRLSPSARRAVLKSMESEPQPVATKRPAAHAKRSKIITLFIYFCLVTVSIVAGIARLVYLGSTYLAQRFSLALGRTGDIMPVIKERS